MYPGTASSSPLILETRHRTRGNHGASHGSLSNPALRWVVGNSRASTPATMPIPSARPDCQATIMPNDRQSIADKVRKLSKMTTANGCSESEATFAAERIAALMAEYNLTQDELSLKEDAAHCVQDEFIFFGRDFGDWRGLQGSVARLFGCKTWGAPPREEDTLGLGFTHRVKPFVFFGLANDVTACISIMSICYSAVATTAEREKRNRQDFAAGMVERLRQRIDAMRPKVQVGTALIVLKDQLVTDEFAKLGLRLRTVQSERAIDPNAFAKGFAAGAHVNLSGGTNNVPGRTTATLRLS